MDGGKTITQGFSPQCFFPWEKPLSNLKQSQYYFLKIRFITLMNHGKIVQYRVYLAYFVHKLNFQAQRINRPIQNESIIV